MARPHPALIALARSGELSPFDDEDALVASAVEHRMEGLLWSGVRDLPDVGSPAWRRRLV
jgi:hypothetical protein